MYKKWSWRCGMISIPVFRYADINSTMIQLQVP